MAQLVQLTRLALPHNRLHLKVHTSTVLDDDRWRLLTQLETAKELDLSCSQDSTLLDRLVHCQRDDSGNVSWPFPQLEHLALCDIPRGTTSTIR